MRYGCLIVFLLAAAPAVAAPAMVSKNTGAQVFHKVGCVNDDEMDSSFDECGCEVKIEYQQLADNEAINKTLAPAADITSYCNTLFESSLKQSQEATQWELARIEDFKKSIFRFASRQETTFLSPQWLNVVSYDYVYSGGAHGNTGFVSTLYDLKSGRVVDFGALLNLGQVAEVNKAIQQQLDARKDEIFKEVLNNAAPAYIKPDGKCSGCEYVLKGDGLYAIFQHYEVAPYSTGFVEVKLPTAFLNQPIVTMAKGS